MADVQVEVAVVVEIGEGRRGGLVAGAGQAGARGDVLEGPVAAIAVERVGLQAGDEQVGMPVVVVIAHGDAQAVTPPPGDRGDSGFLGHVLEGAVAAVAKEPVARSPSRRAGATASPPAEVSALDAVHIEPAVAVEVEQAHASRDRLGQQSAAGSGRCRSEAETGGRGVVDEFRTAHRRLADGRSRPPTRADGFRAAGPRRCGGRRDDR